MVSQYNVWLKAIIYANEESTHNDKKKQTISMPTHASSELTLV